MKQLPTKQRILDAALALFSQKGYDATGVEEIARDVGIKAPSLYKHFSGKEAILEALVASIAETNKETHAVFSDDPEEAVAAWSSVRIDEWVSAERKRVEALLRDTYAVRVRKFLTLEQFRDAQMAALFADRVAEHEVSYYEHLFETLVKKRFWREVDARTAALQYVAPIHVLIALCDAKPDRKRACMEMLEAHIRSFCLLHQVDGAHGGGTRSTPVGRSLPVSLM